MIRAFRLYIPVAVLCLAGIDLLILASAIVAGLSLSYTKLSTVLTLQGPFPLQIIAFCLICQISLFMLGVYSKPLMANLKVRVVSMLLGFIVAFALLTAIFYVFSDLRIWLSALIPAMALAIVGTMIAHFFFDRLVAYKFLKRRVLVLGSGEAAQRLATLFHGSQLPMVDCLGFIPVSDDTSIVPEELLITHSHADLTQVTARDVDEIVVALDERRGCLPTEVLLACRLRGVQVSNLSSFLERQQGRVDLADLQPSWMIFSSGFSAANRLERIIKRVFDLVVSTVFLVVLLPIFLLVALAIWLTDFGPVIYRQTRVGFNGESFQLLKFRSMRVDAENDGAAKWAAFPDHRTTYLGKFLRRTRIDEWPQIYNVFRGEMSFIGPRPERPEFVDVLRQEIPFYDYRHSVKPGITGWAQLHFPYGASVDDARVKLKFDLFYIKNYSLLLDIIILLQTVRVIIWPKLPFAPAVLEPNHDGDGQVVSGSLDSVS